MQDFLSSMRDRAGDLIDEVSSEVDRQRQARKLDQQTESLQQEIKMLERQISRRIVTLYQQGDLPIPEFADACQQILDAESKLAQLNQQKHLFQQATEALTDHCSNCGGELSDNGEFCSHCGTQIVANAGSPIRCGNCGAEQVPGATFCGDCGQRSGSQSALTIADLPSVLPEFKKDYQPTVQDYEPIEEEELMAKAVLSSEQLCNHCHTPLESGAEFCENCGWLIEESALDGQDEIDSTVEETSPELALAGSETEKLDELPEDPDKTVILPTTDQQDAFYTPVGEKSTAQERASLETEKLNELPTNMDETMILPTTYEENRPLAGESKDDYAEKPKVQVQAGDRVHCGVVLEDGMRYCPVCGEDVSGDAESIKVCSHCGATVRAQAHFCPDCGQPVKG